MPLQPIAGHKTGILATALVLAGVAACPTEVGSSHPSPSESAETFTDSHDIEPLTVDEQQVLTAEMRQLVLRALDTSQGVLLHGGTADNPLTHIAGFSSPDLCGEGFDGTSGINGFALELHPVTHEEGREFSLVHIRNCTADDGNGVLIETDMPPVNENDVCITQEESPSQKAVTCGELFDTSRAHFDAAMHK